MQDHPYHSTCTVIPPAHVAKPKTAPVTEPEITPVTKPEIIPFARNVKRLEASKGETLKFRIKASEIQKLAGKRLYVKTKGSLETHDLYVSYGKAPTIGDNKSLCKIRNSAFGNSNFCVKQLHKKKHGMYQDVYIFVHAKKKFSGVYLAISKW